MTRAIKTATTRNPPHLGPSALSLASGLLGGERYLMAGESDIALAMTEEGLPLARQANAPAEIRMNLLAMAGALADRDPDRARELVHESIRSQNTTVSWGPVVATQTVLIAARTDDWPLVLDLCTRAIRELHWDGDRPQLAGILNVVARAIAPTQPETAAVLQGAAGRLAMDAIGMSGADARAGSRTAAKGSAFSFLTELRRETTSLLRSNLDEAQIRELRAQAQAFDEERAVAVAIEAATRPVGT